MESRDGTHEGGRAWRRTWGVVLALSVAACGGGSGVGAEQAAVAPGSAPATGVATAAQTDQLLVRWVGEVSRRQFAERAAEFELSLSADAGLALRALRQTRAGSVVMALSHPLPETEVAQIAARIAARADVAFAEVDRRLQSDDWPNDSRWSEQWALKGQAQAPAGIDAPSAWMGQLAEVSEVVVAVLDTEVFSRRPAGPPAARLRLCVPGPDGQ